MESIFIIAEIGQAHEGSLGIAHSYIDALADTGVNAIKFQIHIAEAESSLFEPFRVNFSYEDKIRYDYWKRIEFTKEQWCGLKTHCDNVGIEFLASPFSLAAVDLLEEIGVKRYKIGSGEVTNLLMIDKIIRTGKPIILSSGMSSYKELDSTVSIIKEHGNYLSILQCTTAYPTEPKEWGLNVLTELRTKYEVPVGFSDHSGDIYACLAATALGANVIEFHVVFDKKMFGPDSKSSITLKQTEQLVIGIRSIESAIQNPIDKNHIVKFYNLKNMFEKSLAVNRDIRAGEEIRMEILETKKPSGYGISASEFQKIIGKKAKHDISAWSFINYTDLI